MALERCGRPGIALTDGEILSGIFLRLRKMYAEQGGANPDQVLNMTWNYAIPHEPKSEEVAMESNGKALADIPIRQPVRLWSRKANNLARSPNCAMTVQPPVAAGFRR